jgi:hypothetical protein
MQFARLALNAVVGGNDKGFALLREFPFAAQELDANGAIHFSIGQDPLRHHDIGTIVDFIEDGIFYILRFHRCSAYESGCPVLCNGKVAHPALNSERNIPCGDAFSLLYF